MSTTLCPVWSYVLAVAGIAGMLVAARRPQLGWSLTIAAQGLWVAYAISTGQWGFIATALAYTVCYWRLLRAAGRRVLPVPWCSACQDRERAERGQC